MQYVLYYFNTVIGHLLAECDDLHTVNYIEAASMDVSLLLTNYKGQVLSSAVEAFQGSPRGRFQVPIKNKKFSILFHNEDKTQCTHWHLIGFQITISGVESYAIRIGKTTSETIAVSSFHLL